MESGTTFASPGLHGTGNGRLTRRVWREETGTTWQPGTPSKQGGSLSSARNRYGAATCDTRKSWLSTSQVWKSQQKKRVSPKRIWPCTGPKLLFPSFCGPCRTRWAGSLMPDRPLWASWVRWTFGTEFWSPPRSSPWRTAALTYPGMSSPGWPAMLRCLGEGHLSGLWRCVRTDCPMLEVDPSALVFIRSRPSNVVLACCCSFLSSAQRWMSQLWIFPGFYFEGWSVSKM